MTTIATWAKDRDDALSRPCPTCGASIGAACVVPYAVIPPPWTWYPSRDNPQPTLWEGK